MKQRWETLGQTQVIGPEIVYRTTKKAVSAKVRSIAGRGSELKLLEAFVESLTT